MVASSQRVKELFVAALELPDAAARQEFLERECGADAELRQRLLVLLQAHDAPASALKRPLEALRAAQGETTSPYEEPRTLAGTILAGRYKLLEPIGEGGMGTVWVAEQLQPVRRKVAVKLIKAGMDSKAVLARFEAERQALALMDHPNIAKFFDAGTVGDRQGDLETRRQGEQPDSPDMVSPCLPLSFSLQGRPFFVMEYVKGVPLTKYCDDARLSIADRLSLFATVCQAVQHAHQKGIIHRDLKPSNILICLYDGVPVPKVIDFGLAKAMHQPLTEQTFFTAHGQMLGTPLYMSPEQAEFNNLDVDTRTDIYALGVILYELLTGTTPLEKQRFKEAAWQEMLRLIKEEEPPRPSARLSGSAALPSVAAQRHVEPAKLTRLVRGELDWIVMKSLEKDRRRRYETASGLAKDIERHLRDEPVEACPPSAMYRLRKFMHRHRTAVNTAWLLFCVIIGSAVFSVWQMARTMEANRILAMASRQLLEERDAVQRSRDAEAVARQQAEANLRKAKEAEAKTGAVVDFLQRDILGQADSHQQAERHQDAKPNLTVREALDRAAAQLGRFDEKQPLTEADLRQTIADAYVGVGDARRAIPHLERCRDIRIAQLGPEHPATLRALHQLGRACLAAGRNQEALQLFQELLPKLDATLGKNSELAVACLGHLAIAFESVGKGQEALPRYQEAAERARTAFGPETDATLFALNNLATAYDKLQRGDEAVAIYQEVLRIRRAKLGPNYPDTLLSQHNLGTAYWRLGQFDKALPLMEETYQRRKQILGADHPLTVRNQANLGINYRAVGRLDEAMASLEDAVLRARKVGGAEGVDLPGILSELAETYAQAGQQAKAEALFRELLVTARQEGDADGTKAASWQARLGLCLLQQGKPNDAEPVLRQALAVRLAKEPDDWRTFNTQSILGGVFLAQKKYAEAEPLLRQGYQGMKQRAGTIPADARSRLVEALHRLVQLYEATGKPDEAAKWRAEREKFKP